MEFLEAIDRCHVRSAIFRVSEPNMKYWKNNQTPFYDRVPVKDQIANDWEEYDPRESDTGSLSSLND